MQLPLISTPQRSPVGMMRKCTIDDAMNKLVLGAKTSLESRQKFATYNWKSLDSVRNYAVLRNTMKDALGYQMAEPEAHVIMNHFRTMENTFDADAFLVSFVKYYEAHGAVEKLPLINRSETDELTDIGSPRTSFSEPVIAADPLLHRDFLDEETVENDLERAVAALEEALLRMMINDVPQSKFIMGNIRRRDFQMAMKNALDLDLSVTEARCLFDAFDVNGDGTLSTKEIVDYFHKVMRESKKRLLQTDLIRKRRNDGGKNLYNHSDFKRAVVLLMESMTPNSRLQLPDAFISQEEVQKCLQEQLNVSLTMDQTQSLCHKLLTTGTPSRTVFQRTNPSVELMSGRPLNGTVLVTFYTQLKKYMGTNKLSL